MRYPKFLEKGDTIGYVAPSFGCTFEPYTSAFANARKKLEDLDYKSQIGPNCFKDDGIGISTNPKDCGRELTDMYCSKENQALISCGGGEMMCETLPFVDWEAIKKADAKWYSGFSDNTNFTFVATTKCHIATLYGPCAPDFGMEPWHPSVKEALEIMEGKRLEVGNYDLWEKEGGKDEEHPLLPFNVTEPVIMKSFTGNCAFSGRLIGGCMDCLINLLGTEFDSVKEFNERYKEDGFIWVLEACDLNVCGIRRAIWQMKNAGWFQYLKGFLIGRPCCIDTEAFGINHITAVTDMLSEYNVPILMDLDIGHMKPSMPIVCGAIAHVNYENNKLQIRYEFR